MPGSVGAVLVERPASIEEVFVSISFKGTRLGLYNRVSARTLQLFITTVTRLLVPTMSYTTSSCPGVLLFFCTWTITITIRLADVVRERMAAVRKAEVSGVVINTCGWIRYYSIVNYGAD